MYPDLALKHLALRLRELNRALGLAMQRQAHLAARLTRPDLTGVCLTDEQVRLVLADANTLLLDAAPAMHFDSGAGDDQAQLAALRANATAAGLELPLDALARTYGLSDFEQQCLLLCAAVEIDSAYERLYGYLMDDMGRRNACVELMCLMGGATLAERVASARIVGVHGSLRRTGMLRALGEASSELRQELRLGEGMLECLCGAGSVRVFRDPGAVETPAMLLAREDIVRLGQTLGNGQLALVGLWGPVRAGHAEAAQTVARAAGMPLRRWPTPGDGAGGLAAALGTAAALGAILWIVTDAPGDAAGNAMRQQIIAQLAGSVVPIIFSGTDAWRPASLLAERPYAELLLDAPGFAERQQMWAAALPDATPARIADLAGRFRVGALEVRAAMASARNDMGAQSDAGLDARVDAACAAVLRPSGQRFVTLVEPRRGPDDLILQPALHKQVMEVAEFFRAWPSVAGPWGFGKLVSGRGGIKAMFSGDSGTGKTLAAEVVAGQLGMPLLKIDLAQIVSKWVGETEKHLEAVFSEAEDSHGVLFFDEADALFGKRGEVSHGVDRYANLEVSYLLQRIEDYAGLVILATNLKDNIDAAFTRRFHVTIHFPRPDPRERKRLWEIAFPAAAPLAPGLDLDLLARLDLTGAGITSAARTAGLLAGAEGSVEISQRHVAQALVRQFQREARVLMPAELGPYAALIQDER